MTIPAVTPLVRQDDVITRVVNYSAGSRLVELIASASAFLQGQCGRRFDEYRRTEKYTARLMPSGDLLSSDTLSLNADLKSINTLADGLSNTASSISDGAAIAASNYVLVGGYHEGTNIETFWSIELVSRAFTVPASPVRSIWLDGLWGFGGQWVNSTGTGTAADASTTTLAVSSGALFKEGDVLKCESEQLYVEAVNTNNLTISRGWNGTTAAAHTSAAVYVWRAAEVVRDLVIRLVQWADEQIKAPLAGSAVIGDFSFPVDTSGLPKDLYLKIRGAKITRYGGVRAIR